jgi:hypothetical protein
MVQLGKIVLEVGRIENGARARDGRMGAPDFQPWKPDIIVLRRLNLDGSVLVRHPDGSPCADFFFNRNISGNVIKIGRLASSHLRIDDEFVSRHHASLDFGDGGWALCDLGSTRGTFVLGERVQRCPLRKMDLISIAGVLFQVRDPAEGPNAPGQSDPALEERRKKAVAMEELLAAVQRDDPEALQSALAQFADVNGPVDEGGNAALAYCHSARMAELLIESGALPDKANSSGHTPMMALAVDGCHEVIEVLLRHGANPNAVASDGTTALGNAELNICYDGAERKHAKAAELLREFGATG